MSRTEKIEVRCTPGEKEAWTAHARRRGVSLTELTRRGIAVVMREDGVEPPLGGAPVAPRTVKPPVSKHAIVVEGRVPMGPRHTHHPACKCPLCAGQTKEVS